MTKRSGTPTTSNAQRGRPMVTITLAPAGLAELDTQRLAGFAQLPGRRPLSRGEYVELLLATAASLRPALIIKPGRRRAKK